MSTTDEPKAAAMEAPEPAPMEATEEGQEEPETWDIVGVISPDQSFTCMTEDCKKAAVATWKSSLTPNEPWHTCEDCQGKDFGGWPEDFDRDSDKTVSEQDKSVPPSSPSESKSESKTTDSTNESVESPEDNKANSDEEPANSTDEPTEEEEMWELKMILMPSDLKSAKPLVCMSDGCSNLACGAWESNLDRGNPWYGCLDCQEDYYDGWPTQKELPLKKMSKEHKELIASKCSIQENPVLPDLPEPAPPSSSPPKEGVTKSSTITPPPGAQNKKRDQKKVGNGVTPSPMPPKPSKPSTVLTSAHRKWQEAAQALGGPNARIIVSKPAAKKRTFDMLHDSFRPMNITGIHTELKAVVPSIVLKSCLDEMSLANEDNPFDASDDEGDGTNEKKKAKTPALEDGESFAGSLMLKAGRNANNVLYYTDHTKLRNNGNGLPPEERNELAANVEKAKNEERMLCDKLKQINAAADKLLSEPMNEALDEILQREEAAMEALNTELEKARSCVVDEKEIQKTKKRVTNMTSYWRQRRRLCVDFLLSMEEVTEGTISLKKCLAGDGQIEIESDEAVSKAAVAYGKKKASRGLSSLKRSSKTAIGLGSKRAGTGHTSQKNSVAPTESFVAVELDKSGSVKRIFCDE